MRHSDRYVYPGPGCTLGMNEVPRRVLPVLLLSQFAGTSLWFATNAVMPDLQAEQGWPASTAASLTSLLQLGFILGTLCFAILAVADRHRPRAVFLLCCVLGGGFTWASGWFVHDLLMLKFLRVASGFCLAGIYPMGMKIASQWYRQGLGHALGWLLAALILGSAAPHALRGLSMLGADWNWRHVFPAIALLVVAGGLLQFVALPDAPHRPLAQQAQRFDWKALGTLWTDRRVRASVFGYFGHMWELYAVWVAVPLLLATRLEGAAVSLMAFAVLGSGALSCAVGGQLSLRWGSARVGCLLLALSGLCCLLTPWMLHASDAAFYAWLMLWGLSVSSDSPQFSALTAMNAPPQAVGSVLTLTNSIGFGISILSIELMSRLLEHGALEQVIPWLAAGPLLGLWMMRPLLRAASAGGKA